MKILLLVFILLAFCSKADSQSKIISFTSGTAIVIVTSQNNIWIAADSKGNENNGKSIRTFTECKIGSSKHCFFATAGRFTSMNGIENNKEVKIFDIDHILTKSIETTKNIDEATSNATLVITQILNKIIPPTKISNPNIYKMFNGLMFKSAICTFENNVNKLNTIEVSFINDSLKIKTLSHVGLSGVLRLGLVEEILKHYSENPSYLNDGIDMKNKLEFLIRLEIKAHPKDVDLPIDVLKVNNDNTFNWLSENRHCF